jgi:multidrug resistance efflux pump
MPIETGIYDNGQAGARHSDDIQDIITAVPSWIVRWGITIFLGILVLILSLSALIRYPDVVKGELTINSLNAPKPIVAKIAGKLVKLLVTDKQEVTRGQSLAYLESTADHAGVLELLTSLKQLQQQAMQNGQLDDRLFNQLDNTRLGEVQTAYQTFYQEYIEYKSTVNNGFLLRKRAFLVKDLAYISQQQKQLNAQKDLQQKDLTIESGEYDMHKKLADQKVETAEELRQEESKLLAKKSPLVQTESALISGENSYEAKQKDILELDNQLQEEKGKFMQALNSLISAAEDWKSKYVLTASQPGRVLFSGIIQQDQVLTANQEVFNIEPGNAGFFGEMNIAQGNLGKVREGQKVLIKLHSYPFEEYGMLSGTIQYISDVPYKDSVFISRVNFKLAAGSDLKRPIHLKQGMLADVDIITQDATMFQRLRRSLIKIVDNK